MDIAFRYTVLRYEHDIGTGEFLNSGVLFWIPEQRRLLFRHAETMSRLTGAFPGADGEGVLAALQALGSAVGDLPRRPAAEEKVMDLAHRFLPADDSSLKWSPVSAGRALDPDAAFAEVFDRVVSRYQHPREAVEFLPPASRRMDSGREADAAAFVERTADRFVHGQLD